MENKKKEIVKILIKSFILSILLLIPAFVFTWFFSVYLGSVIEGANILVNGDDKLSTELSFDITWYTLPMLICSLPIIMKYDKLKTITSNKKAKKIVILYYVTLESIYLATLYL